MRSKCSERWVLFCFDLLQYLVKLVPFGSIQLRHVLFPANICIIDYLLSLLMLMPQHSFLNLKFYMLSHKFCHSALTIGDSKIKPSIFEDSPSFLKHQSNINKRLLRTHQWINGRFINNQVKRFILIAHLPNIHDIISHLLHPLLFRTLPHLFNNDLWDIISY